MPRKIILLILIILGLWSGFTYYLYYIAISTDLESAREQALVEARIAHEKDITYRRWAARMGGIYAEITESLLPNPYLDVPDRDPVTESGRKLTLINPAYMTRMVHGVMLEDAGVKAHITSLQPIRPANAPTPWEAKALESFQRGLEEYHEIAVEGGREVMRYMRPMLTEEPCLKCHAKQGYKLGEIRGGISVTVPMNKYAQSLLNSAKGTAVRYSVIFLAGAGLILTMFALLLRHEQHRNIAELALRASEKKIRESEELFRAVFENAGDAIYLTDLRGNMLSMNHEAQRQTGYSREEITRMRVFDLDGSYTPQSFVEFAASMVSAGAASFETVHRRKDGEEFPVEVRVAYFELGSEPRLIGVARDITGRRQAERAMTASLKEKDILLREIHHRVKNNLQIISSLLSIQEQGMGNPEAKAALLEGRGRIASMALIHEQLYHSRDLGEIDLKAYLEQFVPRLVATYKAGRDISLDLDLPAVSLSLDKAIPFGLIMNELVTNAIKHGLKDRDAGEVRVRLRLDGGHLEASVSDDGAGLPPDFDLTGAGTLGLQIVTLLTDQLHGVLTVESSGGAVFSIRIPVALPGA
ncbi:MAG: histidine kinase dimerization/phosphoacceptor domain -containing protein [Acidobacteriota bacterium]